VKKKILCVLVAMLAVALLTIPVMGAPATKIEGVTLTATTTPIPNDMRLVSHDTIRHVRGTSSGPCTLTIPGHPLPEGTWYSEWVTRAKISQNPVENEALIASRVVLTFTGVGTTGTFKGVVQRKIIGG
jgi:hypothetical protein